MFDQLGEPLEEEEIQKVLDDIATQVVKRGLTAAAIMFLEMNKPITYVASQGLIVTMPFLAPFVGADKVARYSRFLQTRENVDRLIERIEELSEEYDRKRKSEKDKGKPEGETSKP
jgi:hypothetical protein